MKKKVVIVGAGPGGLAAAMLLSSRGYEVDVFEKQSRVGGRNGAIKKDGFTFDIGPTFFNMPEIAEELFQIAGRNMHDYLDMRELRHMYDLIFDDRTFEMTRDPEKMREQISEHFPGNENGYDLFMEGSRKKMNALKPILQRPMQSVGHYLSPTVLKALPQLSLGRSLFDVLGDYFKDDKLKLAFTFQAKYLGMSPWECPGAFSILSFMEHEYGIFHPIGGLNQISEAMAKVTKEFGGRIHLATPVKELWLDGKKAKGLILEDGSKVAADEVIINADFANAMTKLVPDGKLKKYSKEKLKKKKYSCSTFMLYLGLDKTFDEMPHHSIVFAEDYKKNVEDIAVSGVLSEDPSIYIQNASVTDPTLAPEGKSTLYILAPVPNNQSDIPWDEVKDQFREAVLDAIETKTEFGNIRDHIEFEHMISPLDWEQEYEVYEGATFNLGHQLNQMMAFRPHNQFEELDSVYLVGGGTHPGSGLPTILESARISVNLMLQQHGEKKLSEEAGDQWVGQMSI